MSATRIHFEEQLESLRQQLVRMGRAADHMVALAMRALEDQDVELATRVVASDDELDALDLEIETECLRLIALQQPMARDLRLIGTAMKMITDLERVGDNAVDVAKAARKLARDGGMEVPSDILEMGRAVRQMLEDVLQAFLREDLELVDKVVRADDAVDALYHAVRDHLHSVMVRSPDLVVRASYLLFAAYYLERMADHIVNIAERVHYNVTGRLTQLAKSHQPNT